MFMYTDIHIKYKCENGKNILRTIIYTNNIYE